MRILRIIGLLLVTAVGLLVLVALGARFNDGPVGPFPGGPLQAGLLEEDPVSDWSFATDEETIELQLLSQERSRTIWILVRDGAAFIPCSLRFPPAKSWHQRAVEDGRAALRVQGRRYPVTLARVEDAGLVAELGDVLRRKYGTGPPGEGGAWYFRVTSRTP
jgi:hypothetical protein